MKLDVVNDWMKNNRINTRVQMSKGIECKDGLKLSVQASASHYSVPRADNMYPYGLVEVGYPSETIPEIIEYANNPDNPTMTVYGYIPINLVIEIIEKHGGIKVGATEK